MGENWAVLFVKYKDEPRLKGRNEVASSEALRLELRVNLPSKGLHSPHSVLSL